MGEPAAGGAPAGGAATGGTNGAAPHRAVNRTRGKVLATRLEVADSFGSRLAGLMGRPSLPAGTGLWLPGTGSIHMLFMRFPIDAVFVGPATAGAARRVVGLNAGLRPWTGIGWARGARGVLELPAGTIATTGTSPGDEVVLEVAPRAAERESDGSGHASGAADRLLLEHLTAHDPRP